MRVTRHTVRFLVHILLLTLLLCFISRSGVRAYTSGMSASYVMGQTTMTNYGTSVQATSLNNPSAVAATANKVIITDTLNQRVLIFNSFPSFNAPAADYVVGQNNFSTKTSSTGGCGFNFQTTAPVIGAATTDGTRMFVADPGNNRVFVYNAVPTSTGVCPDVVAGQTSTSGSSGGTLQNKLLTPSKAVAANGKLVVADYGNNRVLIWNSIPTSSGTNADVVVGQSVFTASTSGTTAGKLSNPKSVASNGTKLVVADYGNNRVLIWNSIPTSSGTNADVVVGQSVFTASTLNAPSGLPTQRNVGTPEDVFVDSAGKLYVVDSNNNRVLIWNSIPTQNNQPADLVIGQGDFISNAFNGGLPIGNSGFINPTGVTANNNWLFVTDRSNNRVLVFQNQVNAPAIDSDNAIKSGKNAPLRLTGTASEGTNNTVQSVSYSVNGGTYQTATPTDGDFNESSEDFYLEFDPNTNSPATEGYTIRIQSQNNNTDVSNGFLSFQPFQTTGPDDLSYTTNSLPTFSFRVNKQRTILRDNLDHYDILVKEEGGEWSPYISNVPVDFASVATKPDNNHASDYSRMSTNNGIYENSSLVATYSDDSSSISVRPKDATLTSFDNGGKVLQGNIRWKVVATDLGGHTQETAPSTLRVGSRAVLRNAVVFPLAVLNISGVGDPQINTYNLAGMKTTFSTREVAPVFYGIANIGATITLDLTDTSCPPQLTCRKTYATVANGESRFGINIPHGDLSVNRTYAAWLRVSGGGNYNEVPPFTLTVTP